MIHSKQMSLMQFIASREAELPQGFVQRFINNYIYRDVWIKSERLYDVFLLSQPSCSYSDFL